MQMRNPAEVRNKKSKYGVSQGNFVMSNPDKYIGRNPPIYRSSWEKDFMHTCDENPAIMQWAAEPFSIPYRDPITGKTRQYWTDFLISYMKSTGNVCHELIEIKPLKESLLEKARSKRDRQALLLNQAKWQACQAFCKANGLEFRIMTEQQLYGKK